MNSVIENLLTRRSIRAFLEKPINEEDLNVILKTAIYAPSGMNKQSWRFTAVTDRAKIQKLAAAVAKEIGSENYDMFNPEVLVIPSNDKNFILGREDNACALENIFLAAHSLGIGSVWINQLRGLCDTPSIRAVLDEFGIPENHVVYGMAALGYPAEAPRQEVNKTGVIHIVR